MILFVIISVSKCGCFIFCVCVGFGRGCLTALKRREWSVICQMYTFFIVHANNIYLYSYYRENIFFRYQNLTHFIGSYLLLIN